MKLVNTRIFANAIEPRASIAQYDAGADKYTWITPSQGVRYMVRVLCDQVFKISDEKMHVLTYDVGGAFGSKEQPYPGRCRTAACRQRAVAAAGEMARFAV